MANQWLRLYGEFATDPKIQMMSEANQRRYIMLLCMRCSNGVVTLHDDEIAFQLRVTLEEWVKTKEIFISKKLITEDSEIVNWDKRQFVSDASKSRVAKHREKLKQRCNVTVTPPDTDTDTDTEHKKDLKPFVASSDRASEYSSEFESFWQAYPEKKSKGAAWKAWQKLKPGQDMQRAMIRAIGEQLHERDLKSQAGLFCPEYKHPSTWLAQRCWEDVITPDEEILQAGTQKTAPKESPADRSFRIGQEYLRNLGIENEPRISESNGQFLAENDGVTWERVD